MNVQRKLLSWPGLSLKAVASLTIGSFLATQVLLPTPVSFAQRINPKVGGGDPVTVSTAQVPNGKIVVPPQLGKIEESFQGTTNKTILFIQDAHDSLEAQENIAKLIGKFVKEKGIKTVFEEGYEGPVPTDKFFGFIKDHKTKQKVSYFLLDKLRLGGAEYAHINRPHDFKLIGVEDLKLYGEGIKCYQESSVNRKDIEADLEELFSRIATLANQYFPKDLKTWLKWKELFSEGKLPLLNYLNELQGLFLKNLQTRSSRQFAKEYPAISILLMAQTTRDPELIKQLNALDSKVVFEEILHLEQDIASTFLQNERDRDIFAYYQGLNLLKRLNRIALTQAEYETAKAALRQLDTQKLADFIVSLTNKSLGLSKEWEQHIKYAIRFYDVAQKRDGRIDQNIKSFKKSKEDAAILVFGGFHENVIKNMLRQQGFSYLVISPKITAIDKRHQDYYKQLMSVGHYSFETPFLVARANKPPSAFYTAMLIGNLPVENELSALAASVEALGSHFDPLLVERTLAISNQPKEASEMSRASAQSYRARDLDKALLPVVQDLEKGSGRSEMRSTEASRKERFDRLFFDQDGPTGFLRNLVRHFSAIEALVEGKPVTPVSIEVQPSGTCNINCRFCGFGEQRNQHKRLNLTVEQMERLIRDIQDFNRTAPHPMTEIKFNGIFSDPLAGPAKKATVRGIELAVEGNFWTGLFTNGIELTEEVRRALVGSKERSAAFVNISLDSSTWENYHRIKKQGGRPEASKEQYLKILENIRALVKMKKRTGSSLRISISSVLQEENTTPEEVEGLVRLAKELGVDDVRFRYPYKKMTGAPQQGQIQAAYETLRRLIEEYQKDPSFSVTQVYTDDETHELMQRLLDGSLQRKKYAKCYVPHLRLTVSSDGQFHPCDHRGYITGGSLGSIDEGYRAVMEGMTRKEAIEGIHPQEDPRCSFCAMYNHYTNELISVLMAEYELFPGLFGWLRKEYQLDERGRMKRPDLSVREEQITQGIGRRIAMLPVELRDLFDGVLQDMTKHAEGPTLKHHLQAMLQLLEGAAQNSQIPPRIREILANPRYKEFFAQFILFHDIGKKASFASDGRIAHEIESSRIAGKQAFLGLDTHQKQVLLKAVRYHMSLRRFAVPDAAEFETFMKEIGLDKDPEGQALFVAAMYLDGRSTWSNIFGDFHLPDLDNICRSYEMYKDLLNENEKAVSRLKQSSQAHPQEPALRLFLDYVATHPLVPRQYVDVKTQQLSIAAYKQRLLRALKTPGDEQFPKNSYRGYVSGADYDPWEMINAVFRDEEFLNALQYLVLSEDGRTRLKFEDQPVWKPFIARFMEEHLAKIAPSQTPQGSTRLAQAFTREFGQILKYVTEINYPYFSNETKDAIKEHLPNHLRFLIEAASERIRAEFAECPPDLALRLFSDLLLESISYKLETMRAYRGFLPRQLYIVLSVFDEELRKFSRRVGYGEDFVPVFLLQDAEPLAYPALGVLGRALPEQPEFVYLNRLSTLSFRERMEYYAKGLDEASDFSKTVFSKKSRFYGYFAGNPSKGIPSALEQIREQADLLARNALHQFLRENNFDSLSDDGARQRILDQGLAQYQDDLERYMIVLTAERLLQFGQQDREAEAIVENLASFFIPESLKSDPKKKAVFIDSGFKGTFPLVLAGLVMLQDLKGQGEEEKLAAIGKLKGNTRDFRNFPLRARAFLYGTDPAFRSAVPNAGFQRFGFGGVNTFIETFPKFMEFASLSAKGTAQLRASGDYQMRLAQEALDGLKGYAARSSAMPRVTDLNELLEAIGKRISPGPEPLLLFMDLDNVVAEPLGYVCSEYWYGDMTSEMPDRDREGKFQHFEYYKRFTRHLSRTGGYKTILDVGKLREELQLRFPGRKVRVIAFSARNETQRPETVELLNSLGIAGYFDEVNLSGKLGARKSERLMEYLAQHGYRSEEGLRADVFMIDDVLHNLAPVLALNEKQITPILFDERTQNNRWKGALWFFERGVESLRAHHFEKAEQFFVNAFRNFYIPLEAADLAGYAERDPDFFSATFAAAVRASAEWLDDQDALRLTSLIGELLKTEAGRSHAGMFYRLATDLQRRTGRFTGLLEMLYRPAFSRNPTEPELGLWKRMEEAHRGYEKSRSYFEQLGLSKARVIENAFLDYAYGWANRLSPDEFAVLFARLLAPYFNKQTVQVMMPQNAVFREQFQWLGTASEDEYEFFYGGRFYHFSGSEVGNLEKPVTAGSYPELKVKLLNRLFARDPVLALSKIQTVIVFPSLYCPVGCSLCLFRAPHEPAGGKQAGMFLTPEQISEAIALTNANPDVQTLVTGGGGEPFSEENAIMRLVTESRVPKMKIYTSGHWGKKNSEIHRIFYALHQALAGRRTPVELEFNISTDSFHVRNIAGEDKVEYLADILNGFLSAQAQGRLPGVSLVLRGLSRDGLLPREPDVIDATMQVFKNRYPEYVVEKISVGRDEYALVVNQKTKVRISYNKVVPVNGKQSLQVVEEMRRDTQIYELDRIFINSDSSVSLGGYYKAVPIADLAEAAPQDLWRLMQTNLVSGVVRREGLAYLWRLANEFTPQLAAKPPPVSGKIELVKNIMQDPQRQLYIYYRIISDLYQQGLIDASLLASTGLRPGMLPRELKALAAADPSSILYQDKTKKLNWGFASKSVPESVRFRNIWWDASDDRGREVISRRVKAIQNTTRIEEFVGSILKKKYGIQQPQISSMTVVGGYIASQSRRFPVKDLDLIVTVPHSGIRDFVPESPFVFGNTFQSGIDGIPGKICVWIVSDEFFNPSTSNIIDVDLALTVQSGIAIKGRLPNSQPAPLIERVKQAFLFLNLLLKMNADLDAGKILKRRLEIQVIMEQLRQIALASTEELKASTNVSDIDKPVLAEAQGILKDVFGGMEPLKLDAEWGALDRLFDLEHKNLDGQGRVLTDDEKHAVLAEKRRQVMEEAITLRASLQTVMDQLYELQAAALQHLPPQEPRAWLIDIFKANTASRSLEEHMAIAAFKGIDYSTAVSLASSTPYPVVLASLYDNVTSSASVFVRRPEEKEQILSAIFSNPALPPVLEKAKENKGLARSESRSASMMDLLLSSDYSASQPYREHLLDFMFALNFGENYLHADAAKNLAQKNRVLRAKIRELGVQGIPREAIYHRFHDFYDTALVDYLGPMIAPKDLSSQERQDIFDEQMIRLATVILNRILYAPNGQRQLYQGLSAQSFERLAGKVISFIFSGDAGKTIFADRDASVREVLNIRKGNRPSAGRLSIGVIAFKDRDGPSVSNRPHVMALREYLASRGIRDFNFEFFDLQFSKPEEFLEKHFDILVLDARQESFPEFVQGVRQWPFSKLADHVLIAGTYLSSSDTVPIVRRLVQERLPNALIADRESEPALAGLAESVLNLGMPVLLVPNLSIPTSAGEIQTQEERTEVSYLTQEISPYVEQLKRSPWFNYYVEASRGCYFAHCTFCQDWMLHGSGWHAYPVENVIETFRRLNQAGVDTVFSSDKSFWGNDLERAEKIARGLIAIGNKVRYTVALRADDIIQGEYLLELFKQSGMSLAFIGSESYEENTLRRFAKGTKPGTNLEAVRILREHGIDFGLGFIIDPLSTVDELAASLTVIAQHDLWRNTTSMFNFLRAKQGTGYQKMMGQEGLLGAFDEASLSYATGFRDTRMAMLARYIQETYQWLPRLSFIFILAKRRNPLKTDREREEWKKYAKYFGMLQKDDFDFLTELVDALRSQSYEKIEKIKAAYLQRYRQTVQEILRGLDPEYPISRNVIDYIQEQLRLKETNKPLPVLPFPDRVRQAYAEEEGEVAALLQAKKAPQPYIAKEGFNLGIVAGAGDVSGEVNDLRPETVQRLDTLSQQLAREFPGLYTPIPAGRLRFSLFNYAVNQTPEQWVEFKRHPALLDSLERAVGEIAHRFPIQIQIRGLMVTKNGAVIAKGYVQNDAIEEIRRILAIQFPDNQRNTHLDKPFIGITVGRITGEMPADIFQDFAQSVRDHQDEVLDSFSVNRPVLQASRDQTGFFDHKEAQEMLGPVNERLLHAGPRILLTDMFTPASVFGSTGATPYRFPLTLSTLKAAIAKERGKTAEVVLFDRQHETDDEALIQRIKSGHFDVVGLSIRIGDESQAQEILDRIHEEIPANKRPLILLGNSLPGQNPQDYLIKYPEVIVVRGEGESALNGIVRYVRGEISLRDVPNITYLDRQSGKIENNPIVPLKADDFLLPSFDFIEKVVRLNGLIQWEASRGCPWGRCSFCNRLNIAQGWRPFPLPLVFEGLKKLQKQGAKEIFWADEDFISGDYDRLTAFSKGVKDNGISMDFIISTGVRSIYSRNESETLRKIRIEALTALRAAGVHTISLGLESGSDPQLKRYLKGVTAEENREAVKRLRELGFKIVSGFIMFDPLMTVSEVQQNLGFVTDLALEDNIYLFGKLRFADANPRYTERVKAEGLIEGKQADRVHYRYRFKDPAVASIVAISQKWRQPRSVYNDALTQALQDFPQSGRSVVDYFHILQRSTRLFDASFLKLITMAFQSPSKEDAFMDSLLRTGFVPEDLREIKEMLKGIRSNKAEPAEEQAQWKKMLAKVVAIREVYIRASLGKQGVFDGRNDLEVDNKVEEDMRHAIENERDQLVKLFDLPAVSRSEVRTEIVRKHSGLEVDGIGPKAIRIVQSIRMDTQPATVFVNAEDFPSLSPAQKQEYLFVALSRSGLRVVVYNERGQVQDRELAALLKLDHVERTDRDLGQAVGTFSRSNVPAIHLSKHVLPSQTLVGSLRRKVAFFKANGSKSGTLATALLWAISGGETVHFSGVKEENGFWTVEETLLDSLQRTYDNNFVIAVAA